MAPPLHKAIQDPLAFSDAVDKYISACLVKDDNGKDKLITMAGLALALGCDKESLVRWVDVYSEPTEHDPHQHIYNALKRAKSASEEQLEQDCYRNRNAMSLALGKCMHGWVEQQHVKHDVSGALNISVVSNIPGELGSKA